MIWPAIIAGAATLAGGAMSGRNSRSQAREANRISQDMQLREMQYNAGQANADRLWSHNEAIDARAWNSQEAGIGRDWNAQQAQTSREFEERMSNTQYQRAVEDMKQAGLNPMLGYSQGGAGTPNGATASANAPTTSAPSAGGARVSGGQGVQASKMENYIGQAVSSGLQAYSTIVGAEQAEAQTSNIKAQTLSQMATTNQILSQTESTNAQTEKLRQEIRDIMYQWDNGLRQRDINNKSSIVADDAFKSRTYSLPQEDSKTRILEEEEKHAKNQTRSQQLDFPRQTGEQQFHHMLNQFLTGGASSASGLKELILKGMAGAGRFMQGPPQHNYYGRR